MTIKINTVKVSETQNGLNVSVDDKFLNAEGQVVSSPVPFSNSGNAQTAIGLFIQSQLNIAHWESEITFTIGEVVSAPKPEVPVTPVVKDESPAPQPEGEKS